MTEPSQTAKDLAAAADLIEEHGLAYGAFHSPRYGSYCAAGALGKVTMGISPTPGLMSSPRYRAAFQALQKTVGLEGESKIEVYHWSDDHYQPEVVEALRRAAHTV